MTEQPTWTGEERRMATERRAGADRRADAITISSPRDPALAVQGISDGHASEAGQGLTTGHHDDDTPSLAAIDGHPLHPVVVPLPIGALAGAFAADCAYLATGDRFWAQVAKVATGAGIATGLLAGVLGAVDFAGRGRIREHPEAWLHAGGNGAALALSAASFVLRRRDASTAVVPAGLALSAMTGAILLFTGWLGGELAYRHRIGVVPEKVAGRGNIPGLGAA
jgi:uncharacterized membrane protein